MGLEASLPESLSAREAEAVFALAKIHDLSHLVAFALDQKKIRVEEPFGKMLAEKYLAAVYRYERQRYELEQVISLLNKEKILHLPLKGAILRSFYPEPWMRTSCDIDLLVRKEDWERARGLIGEKLGFQEKTQVIYRDVSLYSPGGIHLELHFNIQEEAEAMNRVLDRVWEFCSPEQEGSYTLRADDAFFIFHQVAHAAYHFVNGGCGIRPFLDLFLLSDKCRPDKEVLSGLLKDADLTDFYAHAIALSRVWFGGEMHTSVTTEMERYLLDGGVFGSLDNKVALSASDTGKGTYVFNRIFMPYSRLKTYYKKLERYPFLYPYYQVKRWFRILLGAEKAIALREMRATTGLSSEETKQNKKMKQALGLDSKKRNRKEKQ